MRFELEERARRFAIALLLFCRSLSADTIIRELVRQVIRSGGSIGANYIEANEGLSKRDFLLHLRIARKEARETEYWLSILAEVFPGGDVESLQRESRELTKILTSIIKKSE